MVKQILFIIAAGALAVGIAGPALAWPFADIALPEMADDAVAGVDLPADR